MKQEKCIGRLIASRMGIGTNIQQLKMIREGTGRGRSVNAIEKMLSEALESLTG